MEGRSGGKSFGSLTSSARPSVALRAPPPHSENGEDPFVGRLPPAISRS